MALKIPVQLAANCRKTPARAAWLDHLPFALDSILRRWSLTLLDPFDGDDVSCAWVAPVRRADGTFAVLKFGMPHMEGKHEAHGLRFWDGNPTVRLFEFDEDLGAILMERCEPGTALRVLPETEQDLVIAGLLRRIWRSPARPHPFRPLSDLMQHWSDQTRADIDRWPDERLVREGLSLFDELARSAPQDVLLATDLHAGNVLQSRREPWLVIDPKPFAGDPAYDVTQHLFNCDLRLRADPDRTVRRIADLLGLDQNRVRLWTFARAAAEPRDDWHADDSLALARALHP
jgi:streptomycin 6-kinase